MSNADEKRADSTTPKVHELKTLRPWFEDLALERKTFELRRDDRGFRVGDLLKLNEYDVNEGGLTGAFVVRRVTYILGRSAIAPFTGLEVGHVVMGIVPAVLP